MGKIIISLLFIPLFAAHGSPETDSLSALFKSKIVAIQANLATQNTIHTREDSDNECLRRYDRLYNDSEFNIALGLGYFDQRPGTMVLANNLEIEITRMLLAPCISNQSVCGFKRERLDVRDLMARSFIKTVSKPDGKPITIRFKIFRASESPNDDENRNEFTQQFRSNQAEYDFKSALKTADIVFYLGHSRDGGGPDFDPPRLLPDKHVDYNWYHHNKTDFYELLADIGHTSTPPKLLGLLSCYSNMHFANAIRRASPKTGLLVSINEIGFEQSFEGLLTVINGIQRFKCEEKLSSDLEAVNLDKTKVGNRLKSMLEFRNFPPR